MRKLFLIFLMALLPLHFSWAAALGCCQYEEVSHVPHHLAHSFHAPTLSVDSDSDYHSKNKNTFHFNCHSCHGSHSLFDAPKNVQVSFKNHQEKVLNPIEFPMHFTSHIPQGPERPNWYSVS